METDQSPPRATFEVTAGTGAAVSTLGTDRDGPFAGSFLGGLVTVASVNLPALSEGIGQVVDYIADAFRPKEGGPSQCEVEFGIKVAADGGIIVSKVGGEVSMKVKVIWTRS